MKPFLTKAYIGVGSNIDTEKNIEKSLLLLKKQVKVSKVSTFYRTRPLEEKVQNDFYNGIFEIYTDCDARKLKFTILNSVESECHRERSHDKYAPRTIDLDLLLFGDLVMREKDLYIPDPEIYNRSFIAIPLYELDRKLVMPDTHQSIYEIKKTFAPNGLRPVKTFTELLKRRISG